MGLFDFFRKKEEGINERTFNSKQYQDEITAYARTKYFESKQNYDTVQNLLATKGLNNEQVDFIIQRVRELNSKMTEKFQQDLDSGKITDIKVIPNPEHQKGNTDQEQVDKYIAFGAYQMDRGDLDNALELFDKAI